MLRIWRRRLRRWRQRWNLPASPPPLPAPLVRPRWVRQAAVALAIFALLAAAHQLPVPGAHPVKRVVAYVAEADYDPVAWYHSGEAREVMARYLHAQTWKDILRGRKAAPPEQPALLSWPTQGQLASSFGWRKDPGTGKDQFHEGLDLAAPHGTPITAAAAGKVKAVRDSPAYGKVVELEHGGGISTVYAHCSEVLVKEKQEVRAGEEIARVGRTGNAKAPHLHFEVRLDGKPVDPLLYLPKLSP